MVLRVILLCLASGGVVTIPILQHATAIKDIIKATNLVPFVVNTSIAKLGEKINLLFT